MPIITFSVAADADDGSGYYFAATWPPNSGTFVDEPGAVLYAVKDLSDFYYAEVCCMRWDTSTLPDAATVTAANLKLYVTTTPFTEAGRNLIGDYYDFGGEPTVAADWVLETSPSIFTGVLVDTIATGTVLTVPLTNLSGISKTGYTGVRLSISGAAAPAAKAAARFASREDATNPEPQLEVTYSEAAAATVPVVRHALGGGRW